MNKPTPVDSDRLPIAQSESVRCHAIGQHAARANGCTFVTLTPYHSANAQNPLEQRGYTFHFKVHDRKVQVDISLRDLADRRETDLIQTINGVLSHDRIRTSPT